MRADGGGRRQLQHDQAAIAWIHQHEWIDPGAGAGQGAGDRRLVDFQPDATEHAGHTAMRNKSEVASSS
jgi:hypothetical protein